MRSSGYAVARDARRRTRSAGAGHVVSLALALLVGALGATPLRAQDPAPSEAARRDTLTYSSSGAITLPPASDSSRTARPSFVDAETRAAARRFTSRRDSVEWERARASAERASGFRIVISLFDRQLWAITGDDTLLTAPIAVATGDTLTFDHHQWVFTTPRGRRTVLRKVDEPLWRPPDWHYAETALEHGLALGHIPEHGSIELSDGSRLLMRDGRAGVIPPGGTFEALPLDEHVVFDGTLFIPPLGSENRQIAGELGHQMLDLGDGYLLHGTPHTYTIGTAATHGCIRLHDQDIEWLYTFVPTGTHVYIY
jgi:hypothetical protein